MKYSSFIRLCENFPICKLRVSLQLKEDGEFPDYLGSMLHGWFGQSLQGYDGGLYHLFFAEHETMQPKPYLVSVESHGSEWRRSELLHFDITVLGSAVQRIDDVIAALHHGTCLGLGKKRVPFSIASISCYSPQGLQLDIRPFVLADFIHNDLAQIESAYDSAAIIEFESPVRLKFKGDVLKTHLPDPHLLMQNLVRRLVLLAKFWVIDDDEFLNQVSLSVPRGGATEFTQELFFENWHRYSKRSGKMLPFGGLKGHFKASGAIAAWLPILRLGELIHVGGKTTFGLGKLKLIY